MKDEDSEVPEDQVLAAEDRVLVAEDQVLAAEVQQVLAAEDQHLQLESNVTEMTETSRTVMLISQENAKYDSVGKYGVV